MPRSSSQFSHGYAETLSDLSLAERIATDLS